MKTFDQLGLSPQLVRALSEMGITEPTEIQHKSIPTLLEEDPDFIGLAQTGTGKTYTMEGFSNSLNDPNKGIVPRSMEEIFKFIE